MRAMIRHLGTLVSNAWKTVPLILAAISASGASGPPSAPEFSHTAAADWINSRPQSIAALRGRPILIEFWTFDCINCRRTLPWLKLMQQRYVKDDLALVSVHTPELHHEKDPANVRTAVKQLGIDYPVMLDTDFSYWEAMGNRYWPAFYLIDRQGRIVATQIGELHEGQARADQFEAAIKRAIAKRCAGAK